MIKIAIHSVFQGCAVDRSGVVHFWAQYLNPGAHQSTVDTFHTRGRPCKCMLAMGTEKWEPQHGRHCRPIDYLHIYIQRKPKSILLHISRTHKSYIIRRSKVIGKQRRTELLHRQECPKYTKSGKHTNTFLKSVIQFWLRRPSSVRITQLFGRSLRVAALSKLGEF